MAAIAEKIFPNRPQVTTFSLSHQRPAKNFTFDRS